MLGGIACRTAYGRVGPLYEYSAFSSEVSTHYVNLPHFSRLGHTLNLSDLPLDQHLNWRWQDASRAAVAEDVHPYVRVCMRSGWWMQVC